MNIDNNGKFHIHDYSLPIFAHKLKVEKKGMVRNTTSSFHDIIIKIENFTFSIEKLTRV